MYILKYNREILVMSREKLDQYYKTVNKDILVNNQMICPDNLILIKKK